MKAPQQRCKSDNEPNFELASYYTFRGMPWQNITLHGNPAEMLTHP
jgi:hypothetical protein